MTLPRTIAVDGPAGSGKSTISFAVARKLGYVYVDTGAFYRAITLLALDGQLDPYDHGQMIALAESVELELRPDECADDRQYTLLADGRDITLGIHAPEVDAAVSVVSAMPGVRLAVLEMQRALARRGSIIMAGRDIGTVVLPQADLKIFIDANLDKRAERRYQQRLAAGESADLAAIREGLRQRDLVDSAREVAPLLKAPEAVYLDTSELSLAQAIQATYRIILSWRSVKSLPENP